MLFRGLPFHLRELFQGTGKAGKVGADLMLQMPCPPHRDHYCVPSGTANHACGVKSHRGSPARTATKIARRLPGKVFLLVRGYPLTICAVTAWGGQNATSTSEGSARVDTNLKPMREG